MPSAAGVRACVALTALTLALGGCAFTRRAFVSWIDLGGVRTVDAGFREVGEFGPRETVELWPGCYHVSRARETMSVLVPLPPRLGPPPQVAPDVGGSPFSLRLRSRTPLGVPRVTLTVDGRAHALTTTAPADRGHTPAVHELHFSSGLRCDAVRDAVLSIERDGLNPVEIDVHFRQETRTRINYHWTFRT
ncbi:MAG: hypothetical protein ACU85V_20055 [Gammaproteobacteria bacterium]